MVWLGCFMSKRVANKKKARKGKIWARQKDRAVKKIKGVANDNDNS